MKDIGELYRIKEIGLGWDVFKTSHYSILGRGTEMVDTQALQLILDKKKEILSGDSVKIAKQHSEGKLTARERVKKLLDDASFVETDALLCDSNDYPGVVTGSGTINDRAVYVIAQEYTVHGGAMGVSQARKINRILDMALNTGAPVVFIFDSAGVRVDEGAQAMNAFSSVSARLVKLSGYCPIISIIDGPVIGGAAMLAQISDVSVAVKNGSAMMLYGPTVIGSITGKNLKSEEIGGADVLGSNGAVSLVADDEDTAMMLCRRILDYLPGCSLEATEVTDTDDINRLISIPDAADAASLLKEVADNGEYVELNTEYGKAIKTVFCRVGGHSCGILCSDPAYHDGMIDTEAALKASRFIRICDCYDLPLISLIDSKGTAVPDETDHMLAMKTASSLMFSYAEATCPKVSVITGNAIGQSFIALSGKEQADMIFAWPGSIISALTPEAAVQVMYTDELRKGASRFELETAFATDTAGAVSAARCGLVDDVIEPSETRKYLIHAIEMLESKSEPYKEKKHGIMPL